MGVESDAVKAEDAALVLRAKAGDLDAQEALIVRYAWIARSKARHYFLEGGAQEDLAQEGMIGIWKAIREYDPEKNDSFAAFVNLCVATQIKDALRSHNRNKNKALNESVSLTAFDDNIAPEYVGDPVSNYIDREGRESFYAKLQEICTEEQMTVLRYYFEGYTYAEIASIMHTTAKRIDNVLLSVKSKIKKNKDAFSE